MQNNSLDIYMPPYTPEKIAQLLKDPESYLSVEQRQELEQIVRLNRINFLIEQEIAAKNLQERIELQAQLRKDDQARTELYQQISDSSKPQQENAALISVHNELNNIFSSPQLIAVMWEVSQTAFAREIKDWLSKPIALPGGIAFTASADAIDSITSRLAAMPAPAHVINTLATLDPAHPAVEARDLRIAALLAPIPKPTPQDKAEAAKQAAKDLKFGARAVMNETIIIAQTLHNNFREQYGEKGLQRLQAALHPKIGTRKFFTNMVEGQIQANQRVQAIEAQNDCVIEAEHLPHKAEQLMHSLANFLNLEKHGQELQHNIHDAIEFMTQHLRHPFRSR